MHDEGRVMTRALLAATLFLFAGNAYAADMPLKAPPAAPPAPTWTGWYIGVNGGGGWGRVSPNAQDVGPDSFFAGANVPWSRARAGASMRRADWQAAKSATCTRRLRVRPSSAWMSPSIGPVSRDPPTAASPLTPSRHPPASAGI